MNLLMVLVGCIAFGSVCTSFDEKTPIVSYIYAKEKQRFVFEMLLRVHTDLLLEEWIKLGGKLQTDPNLYTKYDKIMVKFENSLKSSDLLPRGEFFGLLQRIHSIQAYGLFGFFYYAKDWDTFQRNVAWARLNANEGMFVWALTVTVIHRVDMTGIILPQIYEIFPQMFLSSKYILKAERFNWYTWNRRMDLKKEVKTTYEEEQIQQLFGDKFLRKDWKLWQWWNLMGLDDGWHIGGNSTFSTQSQRQEDRSSYLTPSQLKIAWTPVDYTRDIKICNDETIITYFTEDVGWNAYWYYLNMDYSGALNGKEFKLGNDRPGEWWTFNAQQILARYNLERLSHGLGKIETIPWHGVIAAGYKPQLIAYNGVAFSTRNNFWSVESYKNLDLFNKIVGIEREIDGFISSGQFVANKNSTFDSSQTDSSFSLQSGLEVLNGRFFAFWWVLSSRFLSGGEYYDFLTSPNVLLNTETMLRDPLAYQLLKTVVNKVLQFQNQFPPYTKAELLLPGVQIEKIEISRLRTYFDLADIDITTLFNEEMKFHNGKLVWDKMLVARQARLNHDPFNFTVDIVSETALDVVICVFIGPAFDKYGRRLSIDTERENFMELDKFTTKLIQGQNTIFRSSVDFAWTSDDPIAYSKLNEYLIRSYDNNKQFHQNISQPHSLFPHRLVLPQGWVHGMPMTLFLMARSYTAKYQQYATYDPSYLSGIGSGVRHIDNMPFGYPLNRKIENLYSFLVPNMYLKDVKIYHEASYDKKLTT